jgi:hypothetical protein
VDQRVVSATNEARNNVEVLGVALTKVHADQLLIKEHLGSHLQAVEDFTRRQLESLAQDLSHRQFLSFESVDRRLEELTEDARSASDQLALLRTGQDNTLASFQRGIYRRIEDLETSATLAIQSLESQVTTLESNCVGSQCQV